MLSKMKILIFVIIDLVLAKDFHVYWNIPSFMCHQYGFNFTDSVLKLNITQNRHDHFRGDKFTILYDPGMFPALLKSANGSNSVRNGGVPQEGSLFEHIAAFKKDVHEQIPDVNNDGIAVIDFEVWRPILRQNFGSLVACKKLSYNIERTINPMYNKSQCEVEATKRFESAGREFMQKTLEVAKQLRPHARWGYYAFPYCFNDYEDEACSKTTQLENDRLHWLFANTDVVLPSVYISESRIKKDNRAKMIQGRVREAKRVASQQKHSPPVLTYVRYVYTDTRKFLTKEDWLHIIESNQKADADGIILWGSSFDLNTRSKCQDFADYLESTMGPLISKSIQINEKSITKSMSVNVKAFNVIFYLFSVIGVMFYK